MVLWKNYGNMEKTMVLWNFDLLWKNYGTMEKLWYYGKDYGTMVKTMVLWKKLWYYTENYGTSIYEGGKHGKLPKSKKP